MPARSAGSGSYVILALPGHRAATRIKLYKDKCTNSTPTLIFYKKSRALTPRHNKPKFITGVSILLLRLIELFKIFGLDICIIWQTKFHRWPQRRIQMLPRQNFSNLYSSWNPNSRVQFKGFNKSHIRPSRANLARRVCGPLRNLFHYWLFLFMLNWLMVGSGDDEVGGQMKKEIGTLVSISPATGAGESLQNKKNQQLFQNPFPWARLVLQLCMCEKSRFRKILLFVCLKHGWQVSLM